MPPRKKQEKNKSESEVVNAYERMPDSFKPKYINPYYDEHLISHPCRIIIVGNSGSGKSTIGLNIIAKMRDTFDYIILVCQNAQEPLYQYLKSKIKDEQLTICEGIHEMPSLDSLDDEAQYLFLFDDLCNESKRDHKQVMELFIRGRKLANGVSMLYLTQSYYAVPKLIRLNSTNVILKKLSSMRDLNLILSDFRLDITKEQLQKMYKQCTERFEDFFQIDVSTMEDGKRYRKNFTQCLVPSDFM